MSHKITVDITTKSRNLTANVTRLSGGGQQTDNAVLYTEQFLTDAQKAQARTNIGAPSVSEIPTKTSELQNDSGFITAEDIPPVPTKTSELENDSGFITSQTEEVTVSTSGDVTYSIEANKIYHFTGQISSLTLTLVATSLVPHYHFDFVSGTTPATISFGSSINWLGGEGLTPQSSMHYEVDILNGRGIFAEFPAR